MKLTTLMPNIYVSVELGTNVNVTRVAPNALLASVESKTSRNLHVCCTISSLLSDYSEFLSPMSYYSAATK
jgi:hypothetical protein